MPARESKFDFLQYLVEQSVEWGKVSDSVPSLKELSRQYGVSITSLREQLSVARAFGFVEARPHVGIRRLPYSFTPAIQTSLSYAIALDRRYFDYFSDLRRHIEANYWFEAVSRLTDEDKDELQKLVNRAWEKLEGNPIAEDLKEIDDVLPQRISVHGILNSRGEVCKLLIGKDYNDFLNACMLYDNYFISDKDNRYIYFREDYRDSGVFINFLDEC